MQTAAYPEETEVPVAQESHPHAHLVSLSRGDSAGMGVCWAWVLCWAGVRRT